MKETLLTGCLKKLDITPTPEQTNLLNLYINEIIKWNRRINLVKADKTELIKYHISDSLAGLKYLSEYSGKFKVPVLIGDAGSGAGLPGIPLSIFMPHSKFYLIERSAKKAVFLKNICILLKTGNIEVIDKDINNINNGFDIILFRAFAPLKKYMNRFLSILNTGGYIIAYKGKKEKILTELKDIQLENKIIPIFIPFSDRSRHLVVLSRL